MEQRAKRKQLEKLMSKMAIGFALTALLFALSLVGALLYALCLPVSA